MAAYGMHEAKTNLSRLVNEAAAGEDVVIQRNGKPVARLVAVEEEKMDFASLYGIYAGQIHMADDFDELPDDIAEAFGMK
jgi:prevent-host-death family protein